AGAVGPDDRGEPAVRDGGLHPIDHEGLVVALADTGDRDHRVGSGHGGSGHHAILPLRRNNNTRNATPPTNSTMMPVAVWNSNTRSVSNWLTASTVTDNAIVTGSTVTWRWVPATK